MRQDYYLATSEAKGTTALLDCVDLNQAKAKATRYAKKHCTPEAELMLFDENKNLIVTKSNHTYSKWSSNGLEPFIDYDLEQDVKACEERILSDDEYLEACDAALEDVEPLTLEIENLEVKTDLEVKNLTSKPKAKAKGGKIGRPKKEPTQVMRVPVSIAHHLEKIVKDYRAGNWTPPEPKHWLESSQDDDQDDDQAGLIDLLKRDI